MMSDVCSPTTLQRSSRRSNSIGQLVKVAFVSNGTTAIRDQKVDIPAGSRSLVICNAGPFNYATAERLWLAFTPVNLPFVAGGTVQFQSTGIESMYSIGNSQNKPIDWVGMGWEFDEEIPPSIYLSMTNGGGWTAIGLTFAVTAISRLWNGFNI